MDLDSQVSSLALNFEYGSLRHMARVSRAALSSTDPSKWVTLAAAAETMGGAHLSSLCKYYYRRAISGGVGEKGPTPQHGSPSVLHGCAWVFCRLGQQKKYEAMFAQAKAADEAGDLDVELPDLPDEDDAARLVVEFIEWEVDDYVSHCGDLDELD